MTLQELILGTERRFRAARLFYGHGTSNARDEAAFLVLRALRLPFDVALSRKTTPAQEKKIESLIRRRIKERIPVPYLLNEAWLADHSFYVDRRVIIPRSHIAELLNKDIFPGKLDRILDLCTGSGCLAILAALAFPRAQVDAVDLSKAALEVAAKNVASYRLKRRIKLIRSDLFNELSGSYDLIITNPPYVDRKAMGTLPAEYRYEPGMALAGGSDGLTLVKEIIEKAKHHLVPRGSLICEIGDGRKALQRAFPKLEFVWPETAAGTGQLFVLQMPYEIGDGLRCVKLVQQFQGEHG
ncbi:MAG TPA: 50S ribosomal protein L3 N(5)-glutamine methyltransferase [Burkholderiales bacterium]|nr:50S ribosomal protein L3 N(5)-glutamine methyltransferase [Burkholderiales bacterium]